MLRQFARWWILIAVLLVGLSPDAFVLAEQKKESTDKVFVGYVYGDRTRSTNPLQQAARKKLNEEAIGASGK